MPLLTAADCDKVATHQRLPSITDEDDYGTQSDLYVTLEANVPIRLERVEVEPTDTLGYTIEWLGFLLASLANPVELDDRFVVDGMNYRVLAQEALTDFDGSLDHYEVRLQEITIG